MQPPRTLNSSRTSPIGRLDSPLTSLREAFEAYLRCGRLQHDLCAGAPGVTGSGGTPARSH